MNESKPSILVVDDDDDSRCVIKKRLTAKGFAITEASSGRCALQLLEDTSFDLALLDVDLGDASGLDILKEIRKTRSRLAMPILMVTAMTHTEDIVTAFGLGANDYVTKPVDFPVLLARIANGLDVVRLHRAVERAAVEAQEATQAKSDFLAKMSHEIRTPLNSLLGYAELLEESDPTPEQKNHLKVMRAAGDALMDVVNNILDLSKIEAGRLDLEVVDLDIRQLVEEVRSIMLLKASAKSVSLRTRISDDVPQVVGGDPTRLRQVLLNLVGNAVKFTDKGSITISVERPDDQAPATLRIAVADTGIGIARDLLTAIFQKYRQADPSTTRRYGGTGLGLSISAQLIDLMHGKLEIQSAVGVGTTFSMTIPFSPAVEQTEPGTQADQVTEPDAGDRPIRILLADDAPQNRDLVVAFMKKTNHRIETACNGREALAKYRAGSFDLVLMDIEMPDMDGAETTRAIRLHEREHGLAPVPILACTAHEMIDLSLERRGAGYTAHVRKPLSKERLFQAIATHVRRDQGPAVQVPPADPVDRPPPAPEAIAPSAVTEACGQRTEPQPQAPRTPAFPFATPRLDEHPECDLSRPFQDEEHPVITVDPDLVSLVPGFVVSMRREIARIMAAVEQHDYVQIQRLGHTIKGSAGAYGFFGLARIARRLECAARAHDPDEAFRLAQTMSSHLDRATLPEA